MATPRTIRAINRRRALKMFMRVGQVSRASLARELGMMRSNSGNLIQDLLDEGALRPVDADAASTDAQGGRPAQYYELNPSFAHFIGVEVGVRHVRLVARDFGGNTLHQSAHRIDVARRDTDAVCEQVIGMVRDTVQLLDWPEDQTLSLGLTFPGIVSRNDRIIRAPILGWSDVTMMDALRSAFPHLRAILCENDANAFAVAELDLGGLRGVQNAILVWLDVGVGGAIVTDGQLMRGQHGFAGEFGHVLCLDTASLDRTPKRAEMLIGRDAVFEEFRRVMRNEVVLEDVKRALSSPDAVPEVRLIVADWERRCASLLASLISVLDPGTILLGGPMSELLLGDVSNIADQTRSLLLAGAHLPDFVLAETGPNAAATGVTVMLRDSLMDFADIAEVS